MQPDIGPRQSLSRADSSLLLFCLSEHTGPVSLTGVSSHVAHPRCHLKYFEKWIPSTSNEVNVQPSVSGKAAQGLVFIMFFVVTFAVWGAEQTFLSTSTFNIPQWKLLKTLLVLKISSVITNHYIASTTEGPDENWTCCFQEIQALTGYVYVCVHCTHGQLCFSVKRSNHICTYMSFLWEVEKGYI